jgi:hypothetical protein
MWLGFSNSTRQGEKGRNLRELKMEKGKSRLRNY